jgi:hypothetical protein
MIDSDDDTDSTGTSDDTTGTDTGDDSTDTGTGDASTGTGDDSTDSTHAHTTPAPHPGRRYDAARGEDATPTNAPRRAWHHRLRRRTTRLTNTATTKKRRRNRREADQQEIELDNTARNNRYLNGVAASLGSTRSFIDQAGHAAGGPLNAFGDG